MNIFDFPESFGFTVLFRDVKICSCKVNGDEIKTTTYSEYESPAFKLRMFFVTNPTREAVIQFLMNRTLSRSNPRWRSVYKKFGLEDYLPYAYVHKLHGVFNMDNMWLLFDDDDRDFRPSVYCDRGCPLKE